MKDKRIIITGGAGSIGSELVRQLYKDNKTFIIDNNETEGLNLINELGVYGRIGDIRDEKTIHDIFSDFKPQIVFHAAALKWATQHEKYPEEIVKTNILGTLNIINEAKKWECVEKLVFISSDKAVNAHSLMGISKRMGEVMVCNQGYIAVRFGNVLGSRGSVIPIWQRQIESGKKITVTDEKAKRYFMTIQEACELVIEAAEKGKGGEIFVLDMGEQINILDLAKKIIKESRKDTEIEIIGLREGETLEEKLMSEEEEKKAIKQGKFFIIKQ